MLVINHFVRFATSGAQLLLPLVLGQTTQGRRVRQLALLASSKIFMELVFINLAPHKPPASRPAGRATEQPSSRAANQPAERLRIGRQDCKG